MVFTGAEVDCRRISDPTRIRAPDPRSERACTAVARHTALLTQLTYLESMRYAPNLMVDGHYRTICRGS
jgi:hypothetical protein